MSAQLMTNVPQEFLPARIENIHERLSRIMEEVESIPKESKKVNGQYTFVSHDAVASAIRKAMIKHGVFCITDVEHIDIEFNDKIMCFVVHATVLMTFVNIRHYEEKITIRSHGMALDKQDKGLGKAVSYAVKYGHLKLFCLETHDDIERDNIEYLPKKSEEKRLSPIQIGTIMGIIGDNHDRLLKLLKFFKVRTIGEIPADCYEKIINTLSGKKESSKIESLVKENF